jgi:hypothetical protein
MAGGFLPGCFYLSPSFDSRSWAFFTGKIRIPVDAEPESRLPCLEGTAQGIDLNCDVIFGHCGEGIAIQNVMKRHERHICF